MICNKCLEDKPVSDFRPSNHKTCKACLSAYERQRYLPVRTKEDWDNRRETQKERYNEINKKNYHKKKDQLRQKYEENIELFLWRGARARAKRKGLPFNITIEDIILPTHCPALNIEMKVNTEHVQYNSFSIDRIIPELGYIKGNIQVISHLANSLKSNHDKEVLLNFAKWILKTFKD